MLWAIRNSDGLWWSDEWGWGSKKGCSVYVIASINSTTLRLPMGGRWVRYY